MVNPAGHHWGGGFRLGGGPTYFPEVPYWKSLAHRYEVCEQPQDSHRAVPISLSRWGLTVPLAHNRTGENSISLLGSQHEWMSLPES